MWHVAIRRQAIQLQEALERVAAGPLSPRQRAFVAACREDLAVILAATEVDTAALLEGAGVESFAALRGLLQRQ
ncbi:MAG: hypothetical protein U0802_03980 [Candidatus Binatia bacterium]